MNTLTIRAKSSGAARRGGVSLLPLGTWVEVELHRTAADGHRLLNLLEDQKVEIQLGAPRNGGGMDWLSTDAIGLSPDSVKALISELEAAEAEAKLLTPVEPEPEPEPAKPFDFDAVSVAAALEGDADNDTGNPAGGAGQAEGGDENPLSQSAPAAPAPPETAAAKPARTKPKAEA